MGNPINNQLFFKLDIFPPEMTFLGKHISPKKKKFYSGRFVKCHAVKEANLINS